MPEIWIPYGEVETLVTIQAENLAALCDPPEEGAGSEAAERAGAKLRSGAKLFICDSRPPTLEFVKKLADPLSTSESKVIAGSAKAVEAAVPGLKGRITVARRPQAGGDDLVYEPELTDETPKLFVGTAAPDPLYGITDPKVEAVLSWVANGRRDATLARREYEPTPFEETRSYDSAAKTASKVPAASFVTVVPRGGRAHRIFEDAPFDAVKNAFYSADLSPAKAAIVGTGGAGYDDTLSGAVRGVWGAVPVLKGSGTMMLLAECSQGLGSKALELLITGRSAGQTGKRKESYVEGIEELFYVEKLKDETDLMLLSGLPELYAKSKLGLSVARGSGEALGKLLNKLGRSAKFNVVTRASETRLS